MDISGAGRRQPRRNQGNQGNQGKNTWFEQPSSPPTNNPQGPYGAPSTGDFYATGFDSYDPMSPSSFNSAPPSAQPNVITNNQLPTNTPFFSSPSPYGPPSAAPQPQRIQQQQQPPHMGGAHHPQQAPQAMFTPSMDFNNMDPNLMKLGGQLFQQQAQNVFGAYADNITEQGKTYVGTKLKYYFAVDTSYVLRKLMLLMFPFTNKDWTLTYTEGPLPPMNDLNAPDLYIPSMAFVTYILLAGFLMGVNGGFTPEKLGIQASSALVWIIVETSVSFCALYLLSINSVVGFFHILAFTSYKFVPMIVALLISYICNQMAYYGFILYSSLALVYFLMKSIYTMVQSTSTNGSSQTNTLYFVGIICCFNVFLMYWLTRHLTLTSPVPVVNGHS